MKNGFIQILIAVVVVMVVVGISYVAYEVDKTSQNASESTTTTSIADIQATTTEGVYVGSQDSREQTRVLTEKVGVVKPTCSVSVTPTTITQGNTAVLSWKTTGTQPNSIAISTNEAASGRMTGGIQGEHKLVDSVVVSPTVSMKYSINFYAGAGINTPDCSTTLTVVPSLPVQASSVPQTPTLQESFERPVGAPSVEQLRGLMWLCGYSADLEKVCSTGKVVEYYFTDIAFRSLTDYLIVYAKQKFAEQQSQNEVARQAYLEYLQYTSYMPPAIPPRIETYSIPVYSGGLQLDVPQYETKRRWEIQWTGDGGGFITDGTFGGTTHFQCTEGRCFSL